MNAWDHQNFIRHVDRRQVDRQMLIRYLEMPIAHSEVVVEARVGWAVEDVKSSVSLADTVGLAVVVDISGHAGVLAVAAAGDVGRAVVVVLAVAVVGDRGGVLVGVALLFIAAITAITAVNIETL